MIIQKNINNIQSVGSGGSGLLLSDSLDDQLSFQPIKYQFKGQIKKIQFNGVFGIVLMNDELYRYGQLDDIAIIPKLIPLKQVKSFSCGWSHAIIQTNDQLFGIGSNQYYELGFEDQQFRKDPTPLMINDGTIHKVICGFRQSFLINEKGLYVCGQNKFKELGQIISNVQQSFIFQDLPNIKKLKCGYKFTTALIDNNLYGWGCNSYGQLGIPKQQSCHKILIMQNVKQFDCGWNHIIILNQNGDIHVSGRGDFGQQGDGCMKHNFQLKQIQLTGFNVKCGSESSFILNQEGLYVAGWNEHGNLGTGDKQNVLLFKKMDYAQKIKAKGAVMYKFSIE